MANKNITDAAIQDAEKDTAGKRGRAKRPIHFYAVPAGTEVAHIEMPGDDWSEARAHEFLKGQLGEDCEIIGTGPHYRVMGVNKESDSVSVKVSLRDIRLSGVAYEGVYNGWRFYASGIQSLTVGSESFDDNDLLNIEFECLADEKNKVPRPRIGKNHLVRRSAISDCTETEA